MGRHLEQCEYERPLLRYVADNLQYYYVSISTESSLRGNRKRLTWSRPSRPMLPRRD